jgi:hypothetical protein
MMNNTTAPYLAAAGETGLLSNGTDSTLPLFGGVHSNEDDMFQDDISVLGVSTVVFTH